MARSLSRGLPGRLRSSRSAGFDPSCADCRAAAAHAYSDATTPGFFDDACAKHSKRAVSVRSTRKPACTQCGASDATYSCAWPVMRWKHVPATSLREGDKIKLYGLSDYDRAVTALSHSAISVYMRIGRANDIDWLAVKANATVLALREAPCGAPCCEFCVREASEARYYGACHWHAWAEAA